MGAGFAEADFWRQTPRLYGIQMRAARQARVADRIAQAEAAWVGLNASQAQLEDYRAHLSGADPAAHRFAADLARAAAGLKVITLEEYRASREKRDG